MRDLKRKTLNSGMWRLSLPSFFNRLIVVFNVRFMAGDIIANFRGELRVNLPLESDRYWQIPYT